MVGHYKISAIESSFWSDETKNVVRKKVIEFYLQSDMINND